MTGRHCTYLKMTESREKPFDMHHITVKRNRPPETVSFNSLSVDHDRQLQMFSDGAAGQNPEKEGR
jgi:hypothetical protein